MGTIASRLECSLVVLVEKRTEPYMRYGGESIADKTAKLCQEQRYNRLGRLASGGGL